MRADTVSLFDMGNPFGILSLCLWPVSQSGNFCCSGVGGVSSGLVASTTTRRATDFVTIVSDNSTIRVGPPIAAGVTINSFADFGTTPYWSVRLNGVPSAVVDAKGGPIVPDSGRFSIGGSPNNLSLFAGPIAVAIPLKGAISLWDWQRLEGWVAHRWGVQYLLPSTHPYRNSPP